METLILLIATMAALHFVYDGILLPTIRLHLRNRLFVLRDELRSLKINGLAKEDEQAFWFVHDGVNSFLRRLPSLSLGMVYKIQKEYESNDRLKREAIDRIESVKNCGNAGIKEIFQKTNVVIETAFVANMGGWFFYLVPIAVLILAISKLSLLAKEILVTPGSLGSPFVDRRKHA